MLLVVLLRDGFDSLVGGQGSRIIILSLYPDGWRILVVMVMLIVHRFVLLGMFVRDFC